MVAAAMDGLELRLSAISVRAKGPAGAVAKGSKLEWKTPDPIVVRELVEGNLLYSALKGPCLILFGLLGRGAWFGATAEPSSAGHFTVRVCAAYCDAKGGGGELTRGRASLRRYIDIGIRWAIQTAWQ